MKTKSWVCEICAEDFYNEVDLLAHQFNSYCEKELERLVPKLPHIDSKNCWCEPYLDYENPETGSQVWVHRTTE